MPNDKNGSEATGVVPLFGGADMRCETLLTAIMEVIAERGSGMPFPAVLGTLRLVETSLIRQQREAINA